MFAYDDYFLYPREGGGFVDGGEGEVAVRGVVEAAGGACGREGGREGGRIY